MSSVATILGVEVQSVTYESLLDNLGTWIADDVRLQQICTVNPEFFVIASQQPDFYRVMQHAFCIADGVGIVLAARLLGHHLPQRVTGTDAVGYIAENAVQYGWRLFLLGAAEGVAKETAKLLTVQYPGLMIAGTYAGSPHDDEADTIIQIINDSGADILLVAYGAPQQDLWISRYQSRLAVNVAIGVGGAYDFITGNVPRAPQLMRRMGLEWLYRLIRQPWRWRRMLRLPVFVWLVIRRQQRPLHAQKP